MKRPAWLLLFSLCVLPACSLLGGEAPADTELQEKTALLARHWIPSGEYASLEAIIFRPIESAMPSPSRYDLQFKFQEDGTCEWLYRSPNDGHYFRPCTWGFDDENLSFLRVEYQSGEMTVFPFALSRDRLVLMTPSFATHN